ncbi:unnamed protein product [Oppiella nova]|uniref:PEHE domain-containing protein n=1 Tax=Oppiella nova TaxID=334625 RepID=A0A7R9M1P8_9ACAR|nr:unnamed protein product [Oppiella nova]CAG2169137.1 unnamed protein product [Oppiella nova]
MSALRPQLAATEDPEVMVRQVNLAAAFHDHISCTKISQQSVTTGMCALQTSVSSVDTPIHQSSGVEVGVAFESSVESDHMYATDNKMMGDTTGLLANGLIRTNSALTGGALSSEKNQISRLTEMILGQLDLIQHQQEQLLKKDRQLQGLKQDREALCLRLEKMEKKIAVLMTKVANSALNAVPNHAVNSNANTVCVNSLSVNSNRNASQVTNSQLIATNSNQNTAETDCEQSGSDTIVESEANSVVGLFTDPTVFTKLYAKPTPSTASNTSVNNVNKSQLISKNTTTTVNNVVNVKIKTEPQVSAGTDKTCRDYDDDDYHHNHRRHWCFIGSQESKKTGDARSDTNADHNHNDDDYNSADDGNARNGERLVGEETQQNIKTENKKDLMNTKESSCDSLSTFSTTKSNKTLNTVNNNRKRVAKPKSETSSTRVETATTQPTIVAPIVRTYPVIKDILTTTKPYDIVVNNTTIEELCVNSESLDIKLDNCSVDESISRTVSESDSEVIEVPNWRLHPVSSCYSLEGTENLDDEVFNRRHQKLENDERRRKRWDIQRLREQRHNERLRTGRYYSQSLGNCVNEKPTDLKKQSSEFTSFYPEITSLHSLEVTDKLPIIAFGHPIPKLPTKYFSLPWNTCEKTERIEKPEKNEKPEKPQTSGRASRSSPQKKS